MNPTSRTYYFVVGAIFFLLLIFHFTGLFLPIENRLRELFIPYFKDIHGISVSVKNNFEFFSDRQSFFTAYDKCIIENDNAAAIQTKLTLAEEENTELRRQLNYFQKNNVAHVLVTVVGKELLNAKQSIIVDGGKKSGLVVGDPVVAGDGILIGKISIVNENTALVQLLNDNESRVGAMVLNKDKSQGVIEGGFGISLQMNLVPRDETIMAGDRVVTSGLELTVPRGLYIGTIAAVENEPYKPFQQAIITPATNFDKLQIVSVLLTN
jgi:rod shape-determining protein MreC